MWRASLPGLFTGFCRVYLAYLNQQIFPRASAADWPLLPRLQLWSHSVLSAAPAVQWGLTAIVIAAENGHHECLTALIAAGADCEAKDHVRPNPGPLPAHLRHYSTGSRRSFAPIPAPFAPTNAQVCQRSRPSDVPRLSPLRTVERS